MVLLIEKTSTVHQQFIKVLYRIKRDVFHIENNDSSISFYKTQIKYKYSSFKKSGK